MGVKTGPDHTRTSKIKVGSEASDNAARAKRRQQDITASNELLRLLKLAAMADDED